MNEPLTLVGLGALVPLVLACAAWGAANAKLNRVVTDLTILTGKVDRALVTQAEHASEIRHLTEQNGDRNRELIALLQKAYGVANTRGAPGADNST